MPLILLTCMHNMVTVDIGMFILGIIIAMDNIYLESGKRYY